MKSPFDYIFQHRHRQEQEEALRQSEEQKRYRDERRRIHQFHLSRATLVLKLNYFVNPLLLQLRDAAYPHHKLFLHGYQEIDRGEGEYSVSDRVEWTIDSLALTDQRVSKVTICLEFVPDSDVINNFSCWSKDKPEPRYISMTAGGLTRALVELHPPSEYR